MPTLPVYDMRGETVGEIELDPTIWGVEVNQDLMHKAVVAYLANQRVGTASSKTRSEVRGGGRKPWRQKGLGRARHGSIRSPIWKGGGVTFGPKPRDFRKEMNKKARRGALRSALSASAQESAVTVLDAMDLSEPKTREVVATLRALGLDNTKVLVVTSANDSLVFKSCRNIPGVAVTRASDLHTYGVLNAAHLLVLQEAVPVIEEGLRNG